MRFFLSSSRRSHSEVLRSTSWISLNNLMMPTMLQKLVRADNSEVQMPSTEMQSQVSSPPSVSLKVLFTEVKGGSVTVDTLETASNKVLLPTQEVGFWLKHPNTVSDNRQHGVVKAAETRHCKKAASDIVVAISVEPVRLSMSRIFPM